MQKNKRILIFNVNWLGDIILSLPFIRAVRENFPDSFIASVIPQRCREILEGCPYLDEIIYFDERRTHRGFLRKLRFIFALQKKSFDTAFLIHRSSTRALICCLAGIKVRIGYYTPKRGWLLTRNIKSLPKDEVHRADYYLGILEGMGLKVSSRNYDFFISDSDRLSMGNRLEKEGLKKNEHFAVLHTGANESVKRWTMENFATLASSISKELNLRIAISGSVQDIHLGKEIEKLSTVEMINLCGKTSLKELAALYEKADFVVCADTGAMHIASAVGAPLICLFGTSSPKITSPRGRGKYIIIKKEVGCIIPCRKLDCKDNRCMKAITSEEVLNSTKKIKTHT